MMRSRESKEYWDSRKPFSPEKGERYENAGGGEYECIWSDGSRLAKFTNVKSYWTLVAHGVGIYSDGRIDWDYSTDGHFYGHGA